ncbi:MAG: rhomboid family intramembrane serine protease [Candidatus Hydrothermarchaeales archaeon]
MSNGMRVTSLLLGINILSYGVLAYLSSSWLQIDDYWMLKFGLDTGAFLAGAYWQIITNMFAHFNFPHLGYNMIFLAIFGAKGEEIYGGKQLVVLYLTCGLFASLASFFYPLGTVSAGASGAIFGILGACLIAQRNIYSSGVWTSLFYGFIFFILAATTGFLAHLVGLIFGFLLGYWITRNWYPEEEPEINDFEET